MQKNNLYAVIAATITLASISSCHKEHSHNHKATSDAERPIITIKEPLLNDTVSLTTSSGKVHFEFLVTDNNSLHDIDVTIINGSNTIFTKSSHVDAKTFSFHDHIMPAGITNVTPLTLKINASDHNSNVESKTLLFYVKP